jgi:hypothetical protein
MHRVAFCCVASVFAAALAADLIAVRLFVHPPRKVRPENTWHARPPLKQPADFSLVSGTAEGVAVEAAMAEARRVIVREAPFEDREKWIDVNPDLAAFLRAKRLHNVLKAERAEVEHLRAELPCADEKRERDVRANLACKEARIAAIERELAGQSGRPGW